MDQAKFISCLPVFKHLGADVIQELVHGFEIKTLPAGSVLFSQGEPGDAFYVINSGELRVGVHIPGGAESSINILRAGECIGEMALITGQPRTATVAAIIDSELACLPRSTFDQITAKHPEVLFGIMKQLLPRYQQVQINLALTHLFGKMDDDLFQQLLSKFDWRRLKNGVTLFHQGEFGDEMYVVVQGRLRFVVEDQDGTSRVLGEVGAGECIGEFALLAEKESEESRRSATVYATRLTDLIIISRTIFEDLICQYPQALLNLSRQITRRAVSTNRPLPPGGGNKVITIISARERTPVGFGDQLAEALMGQGKTLLMDASRFEKEYGKTGTANTALDHPTSMMINAWLDEREREHAYVIYDTGPVVDESGNLTGWARRCLEDTDLILLVDDASKDDDLTRVERALLHAQCCSRVEMVFVHANGVLTPSGTKDRLGKRVSGGIPIQTAHHVRLENKVDFRRLARRIAERPVGLTLSGGGARGWAHVGVLRALEELDLEFDWVAGASMGAIVAAGISLDWSSQQLCEMAARFSDPRKLLDYTFPYTAFTATRRITTMLQAQFKGVDIEDTWHPFFCVSADLTDGEEHIYASGPLWKAVRASMAFPGIFAPISDEGHVHIDGGAANNLPIDRMRERCPSGTVIGVQLLTDSPVSGKYDFGPSINGWRSLLSIIFPFARKVKVPHLLSVIDGLVYSNNRYRLNESWRCADLLVKIPVASYGLLQFDRYADIIETGYQAACEQLKDYKIQPSGG